MKNQSFTFFSLGTVTLYVVLLLGVKTDQEFIYRWWLLLLYFVTLLTLPLFFLISKRKTLQKTLHSSLKKLKTSEGKKDLFLFLIIVFFATITRLFFLKDHPFIVWGDELWETGLDTLSLLSGEIKNFYLIGFPDSYRMPSMGLVVTLIPSLFARFFAHTPYMYRIPAALFGIADIVLVYLLCRVYINRVVAVFASLTLTALPIHIYFSRTELVVISDAFITTCTIFLLFLTNKRFLGNIRWFALIGLWFGFTATFHPSVRIISLLSLTALPFGYAVKTFKAKNQNSKWSTWGKCVIIFFIFALIGFGPKILYKSSISLANSQMSTLFQEIHLNEGLWFAPEVKTQLGKNISNILTNRYPTSFLGYITKPLANLVEFHYTEGKPLLPPLLAFLFLMGLISLFWISSSLSKWFGFFALLIPLTHSALTPELNWSYRLFIASSSVAVIVAVGLWQITSKVTIDFIKYSITTAFCLYLFVITTRFFVLEPHMANRPVEEYITTHLSYFLQSRLNRNRAYNYCMRVAPEQLKFLNWVHAHNQYKYFVPNVAIKVSSDSHVPTNSLYLDENCQPKPSYAQYIVECSQNLFPICPQPTAFRKQNEPNEINKDFIFYY